MIMRAALIATACAAAACTGSVTPSACAYDTDCDPGEVCTQGSCAPKSVICPSLQPTFASINTGLIQVSCGIGNTGCHSPQATGTGKIDLATDPFRALVGSGTGAPAAVVDGRPSGLLEVKPGAPDDSFLVQKLRIQTQTAPLGAGMPPDRPRAVCDDAIDVVRDWITKGAVKE